MTTRVLLAEDDEAIASPLARALSREGYEVDPAMLAGNTEKYHGNALRYRDELRRLD